MHSPVRAFFLGANVLLFALLVVIGTPAAVTPAVAAPLAFLDFRSTEYHPLPSASDSVVKHLPSEDHAAKRDVLHSVATTQNSSRHLSSRDSDLFLQRLSSLNDCFTAMSGHAANFRAYSQQAYTTQDDEYQQQSIEELTAFQTGLGTFQSLLAQLGSDKGLANYDRTNELETLLKQVVNMNKDTLSVVTKVTYQIPGLGSTLGPIVYDIKCILDLTLDAVENLTDAIINAIEPLLQQLIGTASDMSCSLGLLGLCIL